MIMIDFIYQADPQMLGIAFGAVGIVLWLVFCRRDGARDD